MSTQITVPDFWMLFDAEGIPIASLTAYSFNHGVTPTADQAWQEHEPNKRKRDRLLKAGWMFLPVEADDWHAFWFGERRHPGLPA